MATQEADNNCHGERKLTKSMSAAIGSCKPYGEPVLKKDLTQ